MKHKPGAALLSALLVLLAVYTLYIVYLHRKYAHIPSPKPRNFFLGHVPGMLKMRENNGKFPPFQDIAEHWMNVANSNTVVVFIFHRVMVLTADSKVVKMIAMEKKHGKCNKMIGPLCNILRQSMLLVPDYESWIHQKKIMDPIFCKNYLKKLVPKFSSIIDCHLKKMQNVADGETTVPLIRYVQDFVLSIVSESLFSLTLGELQERMSRLITVPDKYATSRGSNPLAYALCRGNDMLYKDFASISIFLRKCFNPIESREYQRIMDAVRTLGKDLIEERIKALERGEEIPEDALSQILQFTSLKGIDMEQLVDNFYNLLGGGFDTTINLMHFTIAILANNQTSEPVLTEIDEVLEGRTEVLASDVSKLVYLEQVLNETLRLYPILTAGPLKLLDSDIEVDTNMTIPAKTTVMLMSSVITKKEEYFEDPERFNPDRFAPETRPDLFHFFPFGVGARGCIGKHFAMMEAKMFLARFFQTFTITLPPDYKIVPVQEGLTLKPKGALDCTLKPVA